MKKDEIPELICVIEGVAAFNLEEYFRAMKTRYDDFSGFEREENIHPKYLAIFKEAWDDIEEYTFSEAMAISNMEKRRAIFSCLGPDKIFAETNPELVDKQEISKKRIRWDKSDIAYEHEFTDIYELYKVKASVLFGEATMQAFGFGGVEQYIHAVRCFCTTTGREYWIMVEPINRWSAFSSGVPHRNNDAISAIASTIRIREKNPKRIFRQGDVVVVEHWGDKRDEELYSTPQPLSKDQYLNLMYSET